MVEQALVDISRSFLIPTSELTLTDQKTFRHDAVEAAIARALALRVVSTRGELVVRDIMAQTDLGVTAVALNDWWWTGALAAVGVWQIYINIALAVTSTLVFYGISYTNAAPSIPMIRFRSGALGGGRTAALIDLECLTSKMDSDGYLSEPVTYDRQEVVFVQILPRLVVAAPGHRLVLRGFIVEPKALNVS